MEIAISGELLPRANTKAFIIYCDTRNTAAMADDGLDYWPEPNAKAPICGDFVRNGLETDAATLKQIYDSSLIVLYRLLFII